MVQSGVGKIPTSIAVTIAATKYPKLCDFFLNIGIAGSLNRNLPIGSIHHIHKITDYSTSRSYYPDILNVSPWSSVSLLTVDKPCTDGLNYETTLIDMEASGYFQAATVFNETHRIHSIKIVSDYLDGSICNKETVEGYMTIHGGEILSWLESEKKYQSSKVEDSPDSKILLDTVKHNLLLTHSQSLQLKKALDNYNKFYKILPSIPNHFLYSDNERKNKSVGKVKLSKLIQFLKIY